MTVNYSLDVSKATFGGLTKLLLRWKGSIYKILWREFLLFCAGYTALSLIYRHCLNEYQKDVFERAVVLVDTFSSSAIPLSFVLGFYVSFVVGRWVSQYSTLPWADRVTFMISSHVHGSDVRSRMIRRTLGRYVALLQVLTFQIVSTSVKRRFPTSHHLVEAGLMTKEERSVYEKVSFRHGKWWLPCHWFTALATRARKEGRIKDTVLFNALLQEVMKFRDNCGIMIGFDWITVPLVYTQVVTIATYLYALSLMIGKQYIDPSKGYRDYPVDVYVPIFTLLQFFFYVGWLKVAEQILNPYGEDDDDYELNWLLDRTVNMMYLSVDNLHMKHPRVKEDAFWNETIIQLPQTKHSAKYMRNPELGSACGLNVEEAEYIPLDELYETDSEENQYRSESMKKKDAGRQNSSFIRRVLSSGFSQSSRKKSRKLTAERSLSSKQGVSNLAFSMDEENTNECVNSTLSSPGSGRKSSLRNLVRKISPSNKKTAQKLSLVKKKQNSFGLDELEKDHASNNKPQRNDSEMATVFRTASAPEVTIEIDTTERANSEDDFESNSDEHGLEELMPPIPEEATRANSLASIELRGDRASHQMDRVHTLVEEASQVLQELSRSISPHERWTENEGKEPESCCSGARSKDSAAGSPELISELNKEDTVATSGDRREQKTDSKKI